ncbi:hypothetical protein N9J26_01235 [bacterium]|nr:hypothetical protein [bacterium]
MVSRLVIGFLLPPFLGALILFLCITPSEDFGIFIVFFLLYGYEIMGLPSLIYSLLMEYVVSKTKTQVGYLVCSALLGLMSACSVLMVHSVPEHNGLLCLGLGLLVGLLTGLVLYRMRGFTV